MIRKNASIKLLVIFWVIFILVVSIGCTQFSGSARHGWEGYDYENIYLSTNSSLGAKALNNWRDKDVTVKKFLFKIYGSNILLSERKGSSEV
jgi:hypothetical protein